MMKQAPRYNRRTRLVEKMQRSAAYKVALLCGLIGCGAVIAADEEAMPDMDFLEYLGSWDGSDEDWVMLAAEAVAQVAAEETRTDPAPQEEESVETDDES